MNLFRVSAFLSLGMNIAFGLIVWAVNPTRKANRFFLFTSIVTVLWLSNLAFGSLATDRESILVWIRLATLTSALLPPSFDLLRFAITSPDERSAPSRGFFLPWALLIPLAFAVPHLPSFLLDVHVDRDLFHKPTYGRGQMAYVALFVCSVSLVVWRFACDLRRTTGLQRAELEFTILGFAITAFFGVSVAQIIPLVAGNPETMQLLPLTGVFFGMVVAYGMVTRRILRVGDVLRRAAAYGLLTCYLGLLYFLVMHAMRTVISVFTPASSSLPHLVAALAVAFSMAPANGWVQRVATHLFFNTAAINLRDITRRARETLLAIGTTDELLGRFAEFLIRATGTDRVTVLILDDGRYVQVFPKPAEGESRLEIATGDTLVTVVREERGPLTVENLRRQRPSPDRREALSRMNDLRAVMAVAMQTKERMEGLLLLGRRLSGRIYTAPDQDAIQLLCDQFGAALDNARMYTALQDGKVYNDILLDSLVSGVVACSREGCVTVFNREARRVLGLDEPAVMGRDMSVLPAPMAEAMRGTIQSGIPVLDKDAWIEPAADRRIPVRLSCSIFHGHQGALLGVLCVFNDLTVLKKLEQQVRRSDRLSSLGTLAAGMAHEIKNPLVSISTFAQLLPDRYGDEEFRATFFDLIGKEVKRIDGIVNRLLNFSRPAMANLAEIRLHAVLGDTLRLVEQQLRRAGIRTEIALDAPDDRILGDVNLLSQVFLNLFLNAMQAMDKGSGTLAVRTEPARYGWRAARTEVSGDDARIRVIVRDTGCGIPPDDLDKIFDPFYTTKPSGTGMGLAVAHGIIEEHKATVEVFSRLRQGATFHILFPLAPRKEDP